MNKFFILFRNRKFNPAQSKWMGWERKRGKLEQFNRLLINFDDPTDFIIQPGKVKELLVKELVEEDMLPLSSIAEIAEVSEEFVWKMMEKKQ